MGSYPAQSKVIASPICSSAAMHYALSTTSIASLKLVPDHVAGCGARLPLSKVWLAGRWQTEWLAPPTCLLPYSTLEPVTASQGVARPFSWRGGLLWDIYQTSLILPLSGGSKLAEHSLLVCETSCTIFEWYPGSSSELLVECGCVC